MNRQDGRMDEKGTKYSVFKIGGANAGQLSVHLQNTKEQINNHKLPIFVVSAIRETGVINTTSVLQGIATLLQEKKYSAAGEWLLKLKSFFCEYTDKSVFNSLDKLIQSPSRIKRIFDIGKGDYWVDEIEGCYSITGMGEEVTKTLYQEYFEAHNQPLYSLNLDQIIEMIRRKNPTLQSTPYYFQIAMDAFINDWPRILQESEGRPIILGGYIPVLSQTRGYTDVVSAMVAIAIKKAGLGAEYCIKKEYPIMSADPREVNNTRVISEMNYEMGAEFLGSNYGADSGVILSTAFNLLYGEKIPIRVQGEKLKEESYISDKEIDIIGIQNISLSKTCLKVTFNPISLALEDRVRIGRKIKKLLNEFGVEFSHTVNGESDMSYIITNQTLTQYEKLKEKITPIIRANNIKVRETKIRLLHFLGNNLNQVGMLSRVISELARQNQNICFVTQIGEITAIVVGIEDERKPTVSLQTLHDRLIP